MKVDGIVKRKFLFCFPEKVLFCFVQNVHWHSQIVMALNSQTFSRNEWRKREFDGLQSVISNLRKTPKKTFETSRKYRNVILPFLP